MKEEKLPESSKPADRLCSEIHLFDLCDLDTCGHKRARFCTNEELLAKFESIKEEDDRPANIYDEDELEGDDDLEPDESEYYGDELDDDGHGEDD